MIVCRQPRSVLILHTFFIRLLVIVSIITDYKHFQFSLFIVSIITEHKSF